MGSVCPYMILMIGKLMIVVNLVVVYTQYTSIGLIISLTYRCYCVYNALHFH